MEITKITLKGKEYEIVDKATREAINRMDERYIADVSRADIDSQNITSTVTTDSFTKQDYTYFYFTSTNGDRKLYTKYGNSIPQRMVCVTEYLANQIEDIVDGEIITIHYGN